MTAQLLDNAQVAMVKREDLSPGCAPSEWSTPADGAGHASSLKPLVPGLAGPSLVTFLLQRTTGRSDSATCDTGHKT